MTTCAYIVDAIRTAGGRRKGALAAWHPTDLGGEILSALVARAGLDPALVDDVIVGCVTKAGEQGFGFARNCVLASSLPETVPAVTVDRQCGSSQQAIHFAAQAVMSGTQDVVIAAGVESMTRVPMFSDITLHHQNNIGTGPLSDRIKARYGVENFSQFEGAEMIAEKYGIGRSDMDQFAFESHQKAASARTNGSFSKEILPLEVAGGVHTDDEGIRPQTTTETLAELDTLTVGGRLTAGNSSQLCDGASGVLIVNEKALTQHGLIPIARIVDLTVTAGDPKIMLEEPINATRQALKKTGMRLADIDALEINEAFAPIPLAWLSALQADPEKLNMCGGAIALGHPLGSSGTRLMTTLIHTLKREGKTIGLQAMCEGGGLANVTIIEAL